MTNAVQISTTRRRAKLLASVSAVVVFTALGIGSRPAPAQDNATSGLVIQPQVSAASELLRRPPQLDYAALCGGRPATAELVRDWSGWDGGETTVAPDRMLADAERYIAGGLKVERNKPLARRILEHLSSRMSVVDTGGQAKAGASSCRSRSGRRRSEAGRDPT